MQSITSTTAATRQDSSRAGAVDAVARDERIKAHLYLVRSIAGGLRSRPIGRGVEFEDLGAYGAMGLLEAASRFDGARGIPFGAFARRRILGAIVDGIRAQHWFGRRAYHHLRIDQARAANAPANDPGGASFSPAGLAIVYLENGTNAGGDDWLAGSAEAGQVRHDARWNGRRMFQLPVEEDDALQSLAAAQLRLLPPRERCLLDLCYYQGKTLNQAASEMGFSRSRASRLHARALATLRATIEKAIPPLPSQPAVRKRETLVRVRTDRSQCLPDTATVES